MTKKKTDFSDFSGQQLRVYFWNISNWVATVNFQPWTWCISEYRLEHVCPVTRNVNLSPCDERYSGKFCPVRNFGRSGNDNQSWHRREQAHWGRWDRCKILELFVSAPFFWYTLMTPIRGGEGEPNKRGWQIRVDELTQRSLICGGIYKTPSASVFSDLWLNQKFLSLWKICQNKRVRSKRAQRGGRKQGGDCIHNSTHSTIQSLHYTV